jgi:hypothetical protein
VPGILLQGLVDSLTIGGFFASPIRYVDANLLDGAAAKWRQQGPWYYLIGVVAVLFLAPPFLRSGLRALRRGGGAMPAVLISAVLFLLAHSLIARKAMRFALPALSLLVLVAVVGLANERLRGRIDRWYRRGFVGVQVALLVWASFWFGNAGPVRAAVALGRESAFAGELLVLDGDHTCVGGFYYLRRPEIHARSVARAELPTAMSAAASSGPHWLVASAPVSSAEVGPRHRLVEFGSFRGLFDLRKRERRYVYRIEPVSDAGPR